MPFTFTYDRADRLPIAVLPWQEQTGENTWTDLDLSSGYTFAATLTNTATGSSTTITGTITGGVGTVTITWSAADLDIAPGSYRLEVKATQVSTSKVRTYSPRALPLVQIT